MISSKFHSRFLLARYVPLLTLLLFSLSCSTGLLRKAETLHKNQYYQEALDYYLQALKAHPDRVELKITIDRLLKEASQYYLLIGSEHMATGKVKQAELSFKKALEFDPGNNEVKNRLIEILDRKPEIKSVDRIKKEMELNMGLPDVFRDNQRMDIILKSKTEIKKIFEILSRSGKLNVLFDPNFRERKSEISLIGVTFFQALERLCTIFRCRFFVLDSKNIIIVDDNRESVRPYEKLVVRNLFFSNIDAEEARKSIEATIKPERLVVNKPANSLIVSDTAENIVWIEKIASFIDKRRGEVEIEIEIIEVDRNKLKEYGTGLSQYQIGASLEGADKGKRLNDLNYLTGDDFIFTVPSLVWKFFSSLTDAQVLARPKVRGLDEEKMEIKVGDKVPIPRTTFVSSSGGGVNDQPVTSYDLQEVGITIGIIPRLHQNREVTLDLKFEMTFVTSQGSTYVPPTLGNRAVSTKLRLLDNETGIIAGLIRSNSKEGSQGIPILNQIPILKEIFTSRSRSNDRTDIVISITPRIIRMPEIGADDLEAWLIGTRDQVRLEKWQGYKNETMKNEK
jgi:general secretion pathway protein D